MIKPFDPDNTKLCNEDYLRDCFDNIIKEDNSLSNAEIFISEIESSVKEKYEEKSELEKAFFITKINALLSQNRKAHIMEETLYFLNNPKKNSSDYLIQFIEIIEAITNFHNSHLRKPEMKESKKLKWIGKPSHVGYLIGVLAEQGYIEAPKKPDGDTNYSEFARNILDVFEVKSHSFQSMAKYLNNDSEKYIETDTKFKSNNFFLPDKRNVS